MAEFGTEGSVKKNVVADAYFVDGTNEVITVKDGDADASAGWYKFTVKNDKYTLEAVKNGGIMEAAAGTQITENGKVAVHVNGTNSFKANTKTVFVLNDDGDVTAYTGIKNVPDVVVKSNKTADVSVVKDGSYVTYVYIDTTDCTTKGASSASSDVVYILNDDYEESVDADENTFYTYDAIVNGKDTTIDTADKWEVGLYTDVTYDDNDYVDDMEPVEEGDDYAIRSTVEAGGKAISIKDGNLSIGQVDGAQSEQFVLADSFKIFEIKDGDVSTLTTSKLNKTYDKANGFTGTIYVAMDDDGFGTEVYLAVAK